MFIGPVVGGALCTAFSWRAGHNAFEAGLVLFPGALAALVFAPDRSIPRDGGDGLFHRVLPTIGRVYGASTPRSGSRALLALGCLLVVLAKILRSGRGANS